MENKIYKLTDDEFINLVKSSLNISEVLFKLGYTIKGNSWGYSQVKQRMTDLNISSREFRGKQALGESTKIVDIDKLLCKGSRHSRCLLRRHIITNNLIPYKCAICGIVEWQGKTLSLELDHINGENNDNRIENLRFLCPNCHSQTTTYGAKNKQLNESKYDITEELRNLVLSKYVEFKNQKKVAETLAIKPASDIICLITAGLGHSNQKYVIQYDSNRREINRFGTITECCNWLMDNNIVKTKLLKTCKNTLNRNKGILWNNYIFDILDA